MDIKKVISALPTGFAEDCSGFSNEQLKDELVKAETSLRRVKQEMKADEKLTGARELLKDLSGAYNEAKKAQRAKIDYTLHVLEERGVLGTGSIAEDEETEGTAVKARGGGRRKSRAA